MKKHWTHFLPDSRILKHDMAALDSIEDKIIRLRIQIEMLKIERREAEASIFRSAKKHWTGHEIMEAIERSRQ